MNKEVKAKWLKALRSEEYDQTQSSLANKEGTAFCCLGVLCDIYAQETEGAAGFVHDIKGNLLFEDTLGNRSPGNLTYEVRKWSDLSWALESNELERLIYMNDNGDDFPQIANWIEEHL